MSYSKVLHVRGLDGESLALVASAVESVEPIGTVALRSGRRILVDPESAERLVGDLEELARTGLTMAESLAQLREEVRDAAVRLEIARTRTREAEISGAHVDEAQLQRVAALAGDASTADRGQVLGWTRCLRVALAAMVRRLDELDRAGGG